MEKETGNSHASLLRRLNRVALTLLGNRFHGNSQQPSASLGADEEAVWRRRAAGVRGIAETKTRRRAGNEKWVRCVCQSDLHRGLIFTGNTWCHYTPVTAKKSCWKEGNVLFCRFKQDLTPVLFIFIYFALIDLWYGFAHVDTQRLILLFHTDAASL